MPWSETDGNVVLDVTNRSFLKWQFEVSEAGRKLAFIDLKAVKEGADIEISGEPFRMYREGFLRGAYVLEAFGKELVRAEKPSVFHRRFVVDFAGRRFALKAVSVWRRAFTVTEFPNAGSGLGDQMEEDKDVAEIARIEPVSWYKFSAVATFDDELPVAVDIFLTTLVLLMWKRGVESS
jgi:hypothetical protein